MKHQSFRRMFPVLGAVITLMLTGCVSDHTDIDIHSVQDGEVAFRVSVPGMSTPSTRALDPAKEKQLTAIDVVIFSNTDNKIVEHHRVAASDIGDGTGGNDYQFRVKGIENTENVTLAVIANAPNEVATAITAVSSDKSKTAFLLALKATVPAKWDTTAGSYWKIPMYGEVSVAGNINDEVTNVVNLTRMLAKVDVVNGVAPENPASPANGTFELTAVHVVSRNTAGLIAPRWNASGEPETPPATTPNLPVGFAPGMVAWANGNQLTYTLSTGQTLLENEIYLFESVALSANPQTPNGLRMVFEGNYTSSGVTKKYYYPVDFTSPDGAYMPVLRNHRYLFTITEAAGRGYDLLGEAVAAFGVMSNLRTSLIVVDESGIKNMVWNGEYFLGVSEKSFSVAATGEQGVELQISTNYAGGWSAAVENPATNSWLTLGATSGQITDKTLTFNAEYNNSGVDRTATITLTAGRLTLAVTVSQPKIIEFYPPMHGGWAGSNIYWDGSKLTFDDVGVTTNSQAQGVYFQWGSLWGISPMGDYYTNPTLYLPDGTTTSGTPWSSIPRVGDETINSYPPPGTSPSNPPAVYSARDRAHLYEITNGATGIGDICKYLTDQAGGTIHGKRWRMPTSNEFNATSGAYNSVGNYDAQTSNDAAGKYVIDSYKTKAGFGNPWFPASGYSSSTFLYGVGRDGYYWSGSPATTNGYLLYFTESIVNPANNFNRFFGFSVRCVAAEYFIAAEPAPKYQLDGTTLHSFKVKSNTQWAVSSVSDPNGILLNSASQIADMKAYQSGGNNAINGDDFTFTLIYDDEGDFSGKTFTITFHDPTGKADKISVTIKAVACGINGNATLRTVGNKKYLTHMYDDNCWMVENSKEGDYNTVFQYYNNDPNYDNGPFYHNSQKESACPEGWHIPTYVEASSLVAIIGNDRSANEVKWWTNVDHGAYGGAYIRIMGTTDGFVGWGTMGMWWSENNYEFFSNNTNQTQNIVLVLANDYNTRINVRCVEDQ